MCNTLYFDGLCPHSSIDAKKTALQAESRTRNTTSTSWLEDKNLFGNEATLSISEDDIQAALTESSFRAPLNSSVRLAPETIMQQKMSRYRLNVQTDSIRQNISSTYSLT